MRRCIGLVVPSLIEGGGVPSVARFVKDTILRADRYNLKLISLAMSSRDPSNLNLLQPQTWFRGATYATGAWEGVPYIHVGAVAGELEFQRFQPRQVLTRALTDCDIIQVVCGSPAWANAVCGLGKPVALQCATRVRVERKVRDRELRGINGLWRRAMTAVTDQLDDKALRTVNAIQVENPWMLDYARELNHGRTVDLRYAPPGIDALVFCPMPVRDIATDPYILCVARLSDPRKNIQLLLEAYARLPQPMIERVRMILAGSSGPPETFWIHADKLGLRSRISYVARPDQEALVSLYQRAAVFALPSDEEGLGVVVLEAMACSVPVVSTRSGGPDGIIVHGQNGYLVTQDDAKGMADCLERLLTNSDLNRTMGRRARDTVDGRYTQQIAGDAFVDIWDRLLYGAVGYE